MARCSVATPTAYRSTSRRAWSNWLVQPAWRDGTGSNAFCMPPMPETLKRRSGQLLSIAHLTTAIKDRFNASFELQALVDDARLGALRGAVVACSVSNQRAKALAGAASLSITAAFSRRRISVAAQCSAFAHARRTEQVRLRVGFRELSGRPARRASWQVEPRRCFPLRATALMTSPSTLFAVLRP